MNLYLLDDPTCTLYEVRMKLHVVKPIMKKDRGILSYLQDLLTLTTSMPLDTAALHIAEPTNPLPPKTTTY